MARTIGLLCVALGISRSLAQLSVANFPSWRYADTGFPFFEPADVAVADLFGDGSAEVILVGDDDDRRFTIYQASRDDNNQDMIYTELADELLTPARSAIADDPDHVLAVDYDLDGDMDLVVSRPQALYLLTNNGESNAWSGANIQLTGSNGVDITALAAGNVTSSPRLDILVGHASGEIGMLVRGAQWSYSVINQASYTSNTDILSLQVADIDNDGDDDVIALGGNPTRIRLFRYDKTSNSWTTPTTLLGADVLDDAHSMVVAEVNSGNTWMEIAYAGKLVNGAAGSTVHILNFISEDSTDVNFAVGFSQTWNGEPDITQVAAMDLDLDGNVDIVFSGGNDDGDGYVGYLLADGVTGVAWDDYFIHGVSGATFQGATDGALGRYGIAIGDIDGNMRPDIVTISQAGTTETPNVVAFDNLCEPGFEVGTASFDGPQGWCYECGAGEYSADIMTTCEPCPEGTWATEGFDICTPCDGSDDNTNWPPTTWCSGQGTCNTDGTIDPDSGSQCTCEGLYFGVDCAEKQNVTNSIIFGFIAIFFFALIFIPCLCFGTARKVGTKIRKTRVDAHLDAYQTKHAEKKAQTAELMRLKKERIARESMSNPTKATKKAANKVLSGVRAVLVIIFATIMLLFAEVLQILGGVALVSRSFDEYITGYDLEAAMKSIGDAIGGVVHIPGLGDAFAAVALALASFDVRDISFALFDGMEVTCNGTQAPGILFVNVVVTIIVVLVVEAQLYQFMRITMWGVALGLKAFLEAKDAPKTFAIFMMACIFAAESLLKFMIQFLAGMVTYSTFLPYYESSTVCDDQLKPMEKADTTIAGFATAMAYIGLFPFIHLLIVTFVRGQPDDVKFGDVKFSFNCLTRPFKHFLMLNDVDDFDETTGERKKSLERTDTMEVDSKRGTLPSFAETLLMLCYEEDKDRRPQPIWIRYLRTIWHKLGNLMRVTFGIWDERLVRNYKILQYAKKFDEDPHDDEAHHDTVLRIFGQATSLIWFFVPLGVVVAKFGDFINAAPPYVNAPGVVVKPWLDTSSRRNMLFNSRWPNFVVASLRFITILLLTTGIPDFAALVVACMFIYGQIVPNVVMSIDYLMAGGVDLGFIGECFKQETPTATVPAATSSPMRAAGRAEMA
uniref:EGF-like domain-containing protein n=1 Tax=Phaeomonas parva TaxID=124430 RepID=A0A7S1U7S4_9STRA|mmetsp:Transcript_35451/g.111560  ORF Transcript_35451/g.111560 Transcript_35451/m.111560 type:complete len:1129 (+) Transcript_35451:159-3545(+)